MPVSRRIGCRRIWSDRCCSIRQRKNSLVPTFRNSDLIIFNPCWHTNQNQSTETVRRIRFIIPNTCILHTHRRPRHKRTAIFITRHVDNQNAKSCRRLLNPRRHKSRRKRNALPGISPRYGQFHVFVINEVRIHPSRKRPIKRIISTHNLRVHMVGAAGTHHVFILQ